MDGLEVEVLVRVARDDAARSDTRSHCVGIAVDVQRRRIYRTHKGPSKGNACRLFCAGLDIPPGETPDNGSDKRLLLDHLPEPIDLDLDLKANIMDISDRSEM